jgi:DinB superfamily
MGSPEIHVLLRLLEEAFQKQAWHGPNLKGSLRGLTAEQAAWRPDPTRHNIWELAVHCAYWKYAVRRKLTGATAAAIGNAIWRSWRSSTNC